jgi:beta-galactosidase
MKADREDVSIITVQANDAQGRTVPTANNNITFELSGPGKIIGVGNGDPSSHEPDKFVENVSSLPLAHWHRKDVDSMTNLVEVAFDADDSSWLSAFGNREDGGRRGDTNAPTQITVYRGSFELPQTHGHPVIALALHSLGEDQSVYLNGQIVAENVSRENATREIILTPEKLRIGKNIVAIVATPPRHGRGNRDARDSGLSNPGLVRLATPASDWKRSLFSGLAQIIVQSTGQPGKITLTARSPGLADGVLEISAESAGSRAAIP